MGLAKNFARDFKARTRISWWVASWFSPPPSGAAILLRMKARQRTPLWLICDVSACLRLHLALGMLALAVRRFLPRNSARAPTPEGIVWITVWQAGCEALLRWVIARQAFRLCGLDPRRCRSLPIAEAQNSFAWAARGRAMLLMYDNMTAIARRWARRIKATMAVKPSTFPDALRALAPLLLSPFFVFAHAPAAVPAGQRIRAPPWPVATPKKHFARALPVHRRGRGRLWIGSFRSRE